MIADARAKGYTSLHEDTCFAARGRCRLVFGVPEQLVEATWIAQRNVSRLHSRLKQQITLATGIIGATLAFSEQVTGARQGKIWESLPYAFAPLAVSIICGVFALMSIAYHLRGTGDPLTHTDVRLSGALQNITFLVAIVAMVFVIAKS